jgi:hypothetical protein
MPQSKFERIRAGGSSELVHERFDGEDVGVGARLRVEETRKGAFSTKCLTTRRCGTA